MNINAFITAYQGKNVPNNHGGFAGECVSLAARWTQEQLGIPDGDSVLYCQKTGGARDLWEAPTQLELQYFDRLVGQPIPGDLLVWGANRGVYGHVAIFIGNQLFQQLGTPVFQPAQVAPMSSIPYLGILRKKGIMHAQDVIVDQELAAKLCQFGLRRPADPSFFPGVVGQPLWHAIDVISASAEYQNIGHAEFTPYSGPQLFNKKG